MKQTVTYQSRLKIVAIAQASIGMAQAVSALPAVVEVQQSMTEAPAKLVLDVTGYDTIRGQLLVALYDKADDFDDEAAPIRDAKVDVKTGKTTITFDGLPVGEYAFKLFHDVNGNGELDTDTFGIPSEPYYFSNDASDPFSAPEFEEAGFILPSGKMLRNVDLS